MELADRLALVNAVLNGLSFLCLLTGFVLIKRGERDGHRKAMLAAFGLSGLFLVSYLVRVALSGTHPYPEDAPLRSLYLFILATHVILAIFVPFGAIGSIWLALKERFEQHKKLVRITFPVWSYVSVTGVMVYILLYQVAGV